MTTETKQAVSGWLRNSLAAMTEKLLGYSRDSARRAKRLRAEGSPLADDCERMVRLHAAAADVYASAAAPEGAVTTTKDIIEAVRAVQVDLEADEGDIFYRVSRTIKRNANGKWQAVPPGFKGAALARLLSLQLPETTDDDG